jgi:hypothetical protein
METSSSSHIRSGEVWSRWVEARGFRKEAILLVAPQLHAALSPLNKDLVGLVRLTGHLFGQSRTVMEGRLTEFAQERKSYGVLDLFFCNHTLARHRPNKGPAANIAKTLHNAIRIAPPPNSWTLYRRRKRYL